MTEKVNPITPIVPTENPPQEKPRDPKEFEKILEEEIGVTWDQE